MVKTMNSFLYSCILGKIHGQFYDRLVRVRLHFCTGWPYSWCIGFYVTSANTIIVKHHSTTLLLLALTLVNIKCFIVLTLLFGYLMHVTSTVLACDFYQLMEKGTKMVLEQMVTTLASVADTAEEKFTTHYDRSVTGFG